MHQIRGTYYSLLDADDDAYLAARAIQFFVPGVPQVYYVGLLAGENDMELVERTGVGRDINRHYYPRDEVLAALQRPVVSRLMNLIRLRNRLSVFDGTFLIKESPRDQLVLRWENDQSFAELGVDTRRSCATIVYSEAGESGSFVIDESSLHAKPGAA